MAIMELRDLAPYLLKARSKREWDRFDGPFDKADGIAFLCPKCLAANGGKPEGVHSVICWQPTVSPEMQPGPGRWLFIGQSFADVTFVAGSSSIKLDGRCAAHFFIRGGKIEMVP
jgi:hypothetical protein